MSDLLTVPAHRREAAHALWRELGSARRVALCTHVNADGDGCGSEAALARLLHQRGLDAYIVNPTPWPSMFAFLLGADIHDRSADGVAAIAEADRVIVLDISDVKRLGVLTDAVRGQARRALVIDHHLPGDEPPGEVLLSDTTACATGELVHDLAVSLGFDITVEVATALYTAILTDTGSFRYSNATPRSHANAARLLQIGVDPEDMYRRVYASVPAARLRLLCETLSTLGVDTEHGLAWLDVPAGALERHGLRSEDLDGIPEYPRMIAGTKVAMIFRDLGHGKVKVSFRSTGDADVHALARQFGGGGHAKASGAMVSGTLDDVRAQVLARAREAVANVR
jgi:phosphoesterase RecJ-like protein